MDHIGSVKEVTEAFPDVQIVMHILEAPYVAGGVSYSTVGDAGRGLPQSVHQTDLNMSMDSQMSVHSEASEVSC